MINAMGEAFELAWTEIAFNFGNAEMAVAAARLRLAEMVLSAAAKRRPIVQELKDDALASLTTKYPMIELARNPD